MTRHNVKTLIKKKKKKENQKENQPESQHKHGKFQSKWLKFDKVINPWKEDLTLESVKKSLTPILLFSELIT